MIKNKTEEISYEFVQELFGSSEKQLQYLLKHLEENKEKYPGITPGLLTEFHNLVEGTPLLDSGATKRINSRQLMRRANRFKRTRAEIKADRLLGQKVCDLIMNHPRIEYTPSVWEGELWKK